jgi:opacity protein-like surface antigen
LLAVGYYFSDNIRAEAEAGYRQLNGDTTSIMVGGTKYTVDSSDLESKAFSAMGNLYFNIPTESKVSPYIGAGIGWAHEQDEGSDAFAYQVMAGLDFKVSDRSTLFAGYRYFGTTDFENKYTVTGLGQVTETASVKAHAIDVGYRFNF